MSESKKITLKSLDGETFVVEEAVAVQSPVIKDRIHGDDEIPLPNVAGKILAKVIEYCEKHVEADADEDKNVAAVTEKDETLESWDAEFVKVDQATLFDLILAANYLNIKGLLDLTCQAVADMIRGKTPGEIKEALNIKKEFTPEEEEELRRENQWAFE